MGAGNKYIERKNRPYVYGIIFILYMLFTSGCAHNPPGVYGSPGVSSQPDISWVPPKQAMEQQKAFQDSITDSETAMRIPQEVLKNITNLSLAEIVDLALLNNKQTRQAWAQARAAQAAFESKQGSYFPDINVAATGSRLKNPALGGQLSAGAWEYLANATLSWLLFDFGGRRASVEETREALFAANWTHNAAIQNVILQVEQAFYTYFTAKALIRAQQAAVDETQISLNATNDRHDAGLATIADVLQARTALSQAVLVFETLQGQIMTTRGVLATAMGLSASTAFDVEIPVDAPPVSGSKKTIEECLAQALRMRPELAAVRAQALSSAAHVKTVRAQGFPSITAGGSYGELYINNISKGINTYDAALGINVPIFAGYSRYYDFLGAKAQADAARADAQNVRDLVALQVWTSYYNLETAGKKVNTSEDLLKSASQNYDAALGRYKAGVGSILDLLTAQAALQNARAQQVQARADWWLAASQLAHDTGTLGRFTLTEKGPEKNDR